jgi:hypothetical protein
MADEDRSRLMPHSRLAAAVAAVSVSATAAVAVWGSRVDPDPALRWFLLGGLLPVLWAYVELAQVRGNDADVGAAIMAVHRYNIAFAGLVLASQVGLRLMVHEGLVDPSWLSTAQRLRWVMVGGAMVVFGNLLPTLRSPWPFQQQPFAWQQVHRFVGWAFVLGGLGVIGCWAFLPTDSAIRLSFQICVITFTLALGRKLASLATHRFGPR